MPRILAIVVGYKPQEALLSQSIASYALHVEKVLLWQNSPITFEHPKVELCGDGTNRGIGPALNYARQRVLSEGYDYLLTMDQDSVWEDFPAYLSKALEAPEPALLGPFVNEEPAGKGFEPSLLLITSGMLVSAPLLRLLGPWREDFAVDALDVDYVLRAAALGIPAYKVCAGCLRQQFGQRHKKGLFHVYGYSPDRLYSIYRNHLLLFRLYGEVAEPVKKMFYRRWFGSRPIRILLGENQRWSKFKAIIRGIRDGRRPYGKRVGVVTWFATPNYGTTLQAYATVKALELLGLTPALLHRFELPEGFRQVRENLNRLLGIRRFWKYAPDPWPEKTRRIKGFCKTELPSVHIVTKGQLKRLRRHTQLFLAGSDQLWNPLDHFRPFEFLAFAGAVPRAAFATSLGIDRIPPEFQDRMRSYLEGFGPISLREQSGVDAVSALTGRKDIALSADPVFLMPASHWRKLAAPAARQEGPYILCYLLSPQADTEALREALQGTGIQTVLAVPAGENPHPVLGEVQGKTGIREFLSLVEGASLVVTDSFHGLCMSAILERDMLLLRRFRDGESVSQNGRLYHLASQLGLEDRFWEGSLPASGVNWTLTRPKVEALRNLAWEVLRRTVL